MLNIEVDICLRQSTWLSECQRAPWRPASCLQNCDRHWTRSDGFLLRCFRVKKRRWESDRKLAISYMHMWRQLRQDQIKLLYNLKWFKFIHLRHMLSMQSSILSGAQLFVTTNTAGLSKFLLMSMEPDRNLKRYTGSSIWLQKFLYLSQSNSETFNCNY